LFGWNVRLLTCGSRYGVNTRSQPQGALRRDEPPGKTGRGKLESANGTRCSEHRSNQRSTGRYLRGRDPVLAFAYRARGPGPRLWITGPAARTERRGSAAQRV